MIDGLWIADSALGAGASFTRDGFAVRIDLPASTTAFAGLPRSLFPRGAFGSHRSGAGATGVQEVDIVRVSVSGPLEVKAKDLGAPGTKIDPTLRAKIQAFHVATLQVARLTVIEFANRLRTEKGQTWVGFGTAVPELVGLTSYLDEDGQSLRVAFAEPTVLYPLDPSRAIDVDLLTRLPNLLGDGRIEIAAEDQLLADARQLVPSRPSDMRTARPLSQQAILVAAVAVEVKVKTTLRRVTPKDRAALVDLILDNPRDVSVAVVNLLHKAMEASIGRSLNKDEPALFKAIERLFRTRNAIAHKGEKPTVEDARELVDAAVRVFGWLDAL
jgi:hypothetical protein